MSEIINFTRLTTSDKLPDKFVTCQFYSPQDHDQAQSGQIFSHLEILSPWFPTSQVGQTIINTLIKEYYRSNNSSELVNFEEAIKKVNEALAQTAQNGETEWIGKLSGVLVLINNGEAHFAQTGKSHAYLYRGGKVNHITEGLENEDAPHPLKTFSNLTSGSLQYGDRIIVANNTFFEIINPNELKIIISSLPPTLAAIECAKILQNHGSQDANAIFFEMTDIDSLANLPPEHKLEAIYLDQQIQTIGAMGRNIFSLFSKKASAALVSGSQNISKFTKEKITPIAKKGLEKTKEIAEAKKEELDQKIEEIAISKGHTDKQSLITVTLGSVKTLLLKIKNKTRRLLIKIGVNTREKSKLYLGLLAGVLIILAGSIYLTYLQKQKSKKAREFESNYNQLVAVSGEADILFSNNQAEALKKYNQALTLSESLKNTKFSTQAKEFQTKANKQIESVSRLTKIEPKSQESFAGSSIALSQDKVYAALTQDLYSKEISGGNLNKIASLGVSPKNLAYVSDNQLIAGFSQKSLVYFKPSGDDFRTSEIQFDDPAKLRSFGSSIYVSDPANSQIYKLSYKDSAYNDKSPYFKDDVNVSNLSDFAIDGSLYTLAKDGTVTRYSRGTKVSDFKVTLPSQEKIDEFIGLHTSESATDLIVIAKISNDYRAISVRKNGEFIRQFNLNGAKDIKDIATDPLNSQILILSDNKVLEYSLQTN